MIRKDVVIAVLATFCLTSTLFMITTSKSQTGVGEYNPWADYNGDGTIDIFDIVPGAVSFGATSTDTTKNVNVTNFPFDEQGNLKTTDYVPKGTFNMSSEIIVQTTSCIGFGNYQGILVLPGFYNYYAFIFNPISENFTITDLCFQLTYWDVETNPNTIKFYLNAIDMGNLNYVHPSPHTYNLIFSVQNATLLENLHSGINYLQIAPLGDFYLQELSLMVSYRYTT